MGWFEPDAPSADLGEVLACRWTAVSDGRHDLIPDGCVDLLWIDRRGTWLCGPDTHRWSFDLAPGTPISGVRFRPGAAATVLRLDADDVRDVRVALADILGAKADRLLTERLSATDDPVQRMTVLEDLVRGQLGDRTIDSTAELAALVASEPAYGVELLAEQTGVSSRQLRRRFDRSVGYGPAFFARIARLQRFARAAAKSPGRGIAELAALAGYVDQPHLAKDCRSLAAMTPRELVAVLPRTSIDVRSVQDGVPASPQRSAA